MPGFVTRRPDDHHHSISEESDRLEACFAIVPPRVLYGNRQTSKNDRRVGEFQAAPVKSSLPLCRIERDFHAVKRTPI